MVSLKTEIRREQAEWDRAERFKVQWREQVPLLIQGLSESEYLVFENMFEMFADLREIALHPRLAKTMPSLEYTFDRSVKMCRIRKRDRLDKQLVLERFRAALEFAEIPEGRPNRYSFRRKLRVMSYEIWCLLRHKQLCLPTSTATAPIP